MSDANEHIIDFYLALKRGTITADLVHRHLKHEGERLVIRGADHYYKIRERFNRMRNPLDFIFLTRSCFNGVMRFNAKKQFNVPFCNKRERFRAAYITKITRQTDRVARLLKSHNWEIRHADWRETLGQCGNNDFVYLDPPYIGRHTDYFNSWGEEDASDLAESVKSLPCGYAISMWKENRHRINPYLAKYWEDHIIRSFHHFYFVGSTENLRGAMEEVLAIKPGFETPHGQGSFSSKLYKQRNRQMDLLGTHALAKK